MTDITEHISREQYQQSRWIAAFTYIGNRQIKQTINMERNLYITTDIMTDAA